MSFTRAHALATTRHARKTWSPPARAPDAGETSNWRAHRPPPSARKPEAATASVARALLETASKRAVCVHRAAHAPPRAASTPPFLVAGTSHSHSTTRLTHATRTHHAPHKSMYADLALSDIEHRMPHTTRRSRLPARLPHQATSSHRGTEADPRLSAAGSASFALGASESTSLQTLSRRCTRMRRAHGAHTRRERAHRRRARAATSELPAAGAGVV